MNPNAVGGPLVQLVPFALILVVFYFLLIRPQQKKAKETQAMLDALKPGDAIVTTGGIHGRVVKLAPEEVQLELAPQVRIRLQRSAIAQVVGKGRSGEAGEQGGDSKSARTEG